MKIAVTADAHLKAGHPERYNALENVFEQTVAAGIENLIIAGDLFDKDFQNYSEFEALCRKHASLQLHIIPGNHDPSISEKSITGDNVHIYTDPTVVEFDSVTFLFTPFEQGATMGEKIAEEEENIADKEWVLIGHGDFSGGVKIPNPREPGTYMPLSRRDVRRFKPQRVFLGHIHKPHSLFDRVVTYVGSPCGLDISETGRRRFVIYDTTNRSFDDPHIDTDIIFVEESFVIVPTDDEAARLADEILKRIENWEIESSEYSKVRLRVEASGYATNKTAILGALRSGFAEFTYFKGEDPSIANLLVNSDVRLRRIAELTMELIEELEWNFDDEDEPAHKQVKLAALSVIYGT